MKRAKSKPSVLAVRATTILEPRIKIVASVLHNTGFEVRVLLWDRGDLGSVPLVETKESCQVRRFRLSAPSGTSSLFFFLPQWWLAEMVAILVGKPRVIHVCDLPSAVPAIVAGRILGSKIVYDIFDFYSQMTINEKPMNRILESLVTRLEHWIIRLVDLVILPHEKQLFLVGSARPKVGIVCIHHSPKSSEERTLSEKRLDQDGNMTVFYSGCLEKGRGLYNLIAAFDKIDGARLIISGFGKEDMTLAKLSRQTKNFSYLGFLSRQEQLQRTCEADIMAIVYDPGVPVYRVASPSKLYEAMMFGKPVIVSKSTVAEKIVRDENCGVCVDYENVEELRTTIIKLAKDKKLRNELGKNARMAYEKKYSCDKSRKQLLAAYETLILK